MKKIPCRVCTNCGLYSDITVDKCKCGTDLSSLPQVLTDMDMPAEKKGDICDTLEFYVQKCSLCGALNFTADKDKPVKKCFNCYKEGIASEAPVLYVQENETAQPEPEAEHSSSAEESDNRDIPDWDSLIGNISGIISDTSANEKSLTLTAVRYGELSFTVTPDMVKGEPLMLGRAAYQAEFLSQDMRVGNNHCTLFYSNGNWYVQDNHSSNGTFINDIDLDYDGTALLEEGDLLKLGHNDDSMEFKVSIS